MPDLSLTAYLALNSILHIIGSECIFFKETMNKITLLTLGLNLLSVPDILRNEHSVLFETHIHSFGSFN